MSEIAMPASSGDIRTETAGHPPESLLKLTGITKDYPGLRALDGVDFELRVGECHILFGENGAGKSTMISMIAGARHPTAGEITYHGSPVSLHSVQQARNVGISAVFQEFSLVPQLSIGDNIFLGAEFSRGGLLDKSRQRREARELLEQLGFAMDIRRRVSDLTRAEQQMVEIAKAFRTHPSVLILDEPTASLTDREVARLFGLIENLKAEGVGIIYITHRMNEVRRIGDRITVLRNGKFVATVNARTTSDDELVRLMTGRTISEIFPSINFAIGEAVLEVESLTTADNSVRNVSLRAHRGEVVGLAGLVGSGKSEIVRACYGLKKIVSGTVRLNGRETTGLSCADILEKGMFYLPPDRREEGLMMMRPCRENMAMSALGKKFSKFGFLRRAAEVQKTRELSSQFQLTPMKIEREPEFFSGGNQQKIMLTKSMVRDFDVFIFDEPTVGVDVGTRAEIYRFIKTLCENGAAVILVSSDLPEVLYLSHRLLVFYQGESRAELHGDDITEENALSHFFERDAA